MILNKDKFMDSVLEFIDSKNITIDDFFQIETKEDGIFMNIPEEYGEVFENLYPDYNIEKTLNSFVNDLIEEKL